MNTKHFVNRHGIRASADWADRNPNMADDAMPGGSHWRVTLRRARRQLTVYFSQGSAFSHEPTAADVLDCLASDASGYVNAQSFEDWASEYGYDTDSRRALATFEAVKRQSLGLERFMGPDLYRALLWDTERL